jgi:predicted Zn-dependent protease
VDAVFYDGQVARARRVSLVLGGEGIEISEEGTLLACWPYQYVRRRDGSRDDLLRLSLAGSGSLERLEITDPAGRVDLSARCPRLLDSREEGRVGPILAWSIAAAASLVACVVFLVPLVADRATPLIPAWVERRLGTAVDNQVRLLLRVEECAAPAGQAALDHLVRRLRDQAPLGVEPDIRVLNAPVPNAFALPGGRIYLLAALLQQAESVDEVAGVLAHEMGHVAHRDGLRRLIQTGGTSFLLGLLFGDVAGSGTLILVGRLAVDGAYSREAERAADRFASDTMLSLGRSPRAMALLLKRIDPEQGPIPAMLSSHPLTEERLSAMQEPTEPLREPLLSPQQWSDLKAICATP